LLPIAAALVLASVPAHGQEAAPATVEACTAVEVDAARLACYDAAMKREGTSPQQADAQAADAREFKQAVAEYRKLDRKALPAGERARRVVSDLFGSEHGAASLN